MASKSRLRVSLCLLTVLISLQACASPQPGTGTSAGTTTPTTSPSTSAPSTVEPPTTAPQTTAPATTTPHTSTQPTGGQTVTYQVMKTIPDSIRSSVESLKKDRGYAFFEKEQLLVIFMGQRSTGGYSISLKTIQSQGDSLSIETYEKSPNPGDMVTQVLTYPLLILQLDRNYSSFQISDQQGKSYPLNQGTLY